MAMRVAAQVPQMRGQQPGAQPLAERGDEIHAARRHFAQDGDAVTQGIQAVEQAVEVVVQHTLDLRVVDELFGSLVMAFANVPDNRHVGKIVAGSRGVRRFEQHIGDATHRRNHRQNPVSLIDVLANNPGDLGNRVMPAHRRTAEFHRNGAHGPLTLSLSYGSNKK